MPEQSLSKGHKFRYGKIIVAFLLGCIAILVSLGINKTTFRQMLGTVKQLSQPNAKLNLVNNIFREVVQLDQLQRLQAIQATSRPYNPFLKESQQLQYMLDTLSGMYQGNDVQAGRINSMKNILHERDKLFLHYLYLQANLSKNDTLITQLKNLSNLIAGSSKSNDSNLVTTEKKVTTTTIEHEDTSAANAENRKNFWDKLFGRKKVKNREFEKLVKEELNVKLDTLALGKEDSIIHMLGNTLSIEQLNRVKRRSMLSDQQLQLTNESNMLINHLLTILRDVEGEETIKSYNNNALATRIANEDINKMDLITIFFIASTSILIFLIFIDIGRSNQYRRQLVAAKEEAEQLGQVKQRFLANMSHEIRTPLQTIIGVAEQMRIKGNAGPGELDMFYHSSLYLLQIVNEVLDYSRIISGRFHFENKPFDMQKLVADVHNTIQIQATKKGLQLVCKTDLEGTQHYLGDLFRLKQILYNLLGNAVKFTNKGVIVLNITHTDHADHTDFTFIVKDTGIGMSEPDIEKIFLEFETLNNPSVSGTGLGLAIVRALVEGQGGNIYVTSELGRGSEFKINLSFTRTAEIESGYEAGDNVSLPAYTGTVWVVDDDKFILQLCTTIFKKYNIPYRCFGSAEEILDTPFDDTVNLVLLDIRLPGMDGMALCKKLKERTYSSPVRFVALTAQVIGDEKEAILQNCFDGLLTKPFMEQELIGTVFNSNALPAKKSDTAIVEMDLSDVYLMSGNDKEQIRKTLTSFITETESDIATLKDAMEEEANDKAAECLHRIASRCGQVGAKQLFLQARTLELDIRNNERLTDLKKELEAVCDEVDNLISVVALHIK